MAHAEPWQWLVMFLPILINLWSIWDCYLRDFPTPTEKMIWLGIAVFVPILGGLAYIFFGRRRSVKPLR